MAVVPVDVDIVVVVEGVGAVFDVMVVVVVNVVVGVVVVAVDGVVVVV